MFSGGIQLLSQSHPRPLIITWKTPPTDSPYFSSLFWSDLPVPFPPFNTSGPLYSYRGKWMKISFYCSYFLLAMDVLHIPWPRDPYQKRGLEWREAFTWGRRILQIWGQLTVSGKWLMQNPKNRVLTKKKCLSQRNVCKACHTCQKPFYPVYLTEGKEKYSRTPPLTPLDHFCPSY